MTFTRQNLVRERQNTALTTFTANGQSVQRQLTDDADSEAMKAIIDSLNFSQGGLSLLRVRG
ncbi:MAG: hypothetical protein R2695_15910 [Acidimicrobiales bacterium]